ncbi:MAG: sigma-54-dependent Fis family transcriptional regulator [Magnetococcales bacterium]|nr:sigma-54-dependent Fis family transcriptional regulator [Magnetococcales bacterium]
MRDSNVIYDRLVHLKDRLDSVNRAWTGSDHEALMMFFVQVLPEVMRAERCSIFVNDPRSATIWLKYGTGVSERTIEAPKQGSVVGEVIAQGEARIHNDLSQKEGFHTIADRETQFQTRNMICIPVRSMVGDRIVGAVQVLNRHDDLSFTEEDITLLNKIVRYLSLGVESFLLNDEVGRISRHLQNEIDLARRMAGEQDDDGPIIARSSKMIERIEMALKVSLAPVNVYLTGESGVGKELIARLIHESSDRKDGPFVAVNCSSIPENLMESEFFGHEKGAFTGAINRRIGRFEEATGGTLFLDEIADMPQAIQPKFLRAIQEREGARLGENQLIKYDFRIISASARNLLKEVEEGRFREDLYFRLFAVELVIPPLRERREDIIPLAMRFLRDTCQRFDRKALTLAPETLLLFETFDWPGNVRQLQHEVERLVALSGDEDGPIPPDFCSDQLQRQRERVSPTGDGYLLGEHKARMEIDLIHRVLEKTGGNKNRASKLMGITRQSLHNKIKRYRINT